MAISEDVCEVIVKREVQEERPGATINEFAVLHI